MAIVEVDALVLRTYRLGETSLIVSLLTGEHGQMRCVAKGARSPKSRFGSSLMPGVRLRAVVYRKLSRDLQLLSKTDIVRAWPTLWEDPERFVALSSVLEFLDRAAYGETGDPALLDLACDTLQAMSGAPVPALEPLLRGFEVQACDRLGYAPELAACLECRQPLREGGLFHPVRGGLLCGAPCGREGGAFRISERARLTLLGLLTQPVGALAGWAAERYPGAEVARAVERFLAAHISRFEGLKAARVGEALARYDGGRTRR
ncbi:MAG TPA: DNA repair protein RecO [Candidatus Eisenbacteria bacterium]